MEDGDTESENASRVIQDFVFLCRKIDSINGYFCRYIIKENIYHFMLNLFVLINILMLCHTFYRETVSYVIMK